MKNLIIVILLTATGVLGTRLYQTRIISTAESTKLEKLQAEVAVLQQEIKARDQRLTATKTQLKNTAVNAGERGDEIANLQKEIHQKDAQIQEAKDGDLGAATAKMLKDPAMREMIKAQSKAAAGMMLTQMYDDLFKDLGMTEAQSAEVKALLEQRLTLGVDQGLEMISGDKTPEEMRAMGEEMKVKSEEITKELRDKLNPEQAAYFDYYEKTQPERGQLRLAKTQFASAGEPLAPDQERVLLDALSDERLKFKFTNDLQGQDNFSTAGFTPDGIDRYIAEMSDLQQRQAARVRGDLSAVQYHEFLKSQKSTLELQTTSMKMAAKMLNNKK